MRPEEDGGAERDRTADLLNAIQALSQLSYSPIFITAAFGALPFPFLGRRRYRLGERCDQEGFYVASNR